MVLGASAENMVEFNKNIVPENVRGATPKDLREHKDANHDYLSFLEYFDL